MNEIVTARYDRKVARDRRANRICETGIAWIVAVALLRDESIGRIRDWFVAWVRDQIIRETGRRHMMTPADERQIEAIISETINTIGGIRANADITDIDRVTRIITEVIETITIKAEAIIDSRITDRHGADEIPDSARGTRPTGYVNGTNE